MKEFNKYHNLVIKYKQQHPEWRWGQTYFNVLTFYNTDLAKEIRGTKLDPFYNDEKIPLFLNYIINNEFPYQLQHDNGDNIHVIKKYPTVNIALADKAHYDERFNIKSKIYNLQTNQYE